MSGYIVDIETDGLLLECTRMWCIVLRNIETNQATAYLEGDLSWKAILDSADNIAGHNILGFDLAALEKLFKYKLPNTCKVRDTLILSQVLNYKRFGTAGHSLGIWGESLGVLKTNWRERAIELELISFNDPAGAEFKQFHAEMVDYCVQDTAVNIGVYTTLMQEFNIAYKHNKLVATYLKAEHAAAKWVSRCELVGWPFDKESAIALSQTLADEMAIAYETLNSKLGWKTVAVDKVKGEVAIKRPKWIKNGCYDQHTANWFGIEAWLGADEDVYRPIVGEYCRVTFERLSLDSVMDVKTFLYRNNWVPTQWNYKRNEMTGKNEKTSPKITEDSIEFLGGDGKLYTDFLTTKSRHSNLKTWIENVDTNGNLHGECIVIGTPSMRARHRVIVNVPSPDSKWGHEMRSLFKCKPGWKLIGCDSSGNQARGLAHYLKDPVFINTLLTGDIHQYNADALTEVLSEMGIKHVVPRAAAKRVLYAFLFGASGGKLWSYLFNTIDEANGKKLRLGFLKKVPGFEQLITKLKNTYGKTSQYGDGYIVSLVGTRIYVDSFHKLLVYLLQATEKITCATALMLTVQELEAENIPWEPCIFYHDEIDFQVPEEFAERAAEIGKKSFHDGPALYGIEIMDGSGKIGNTWYDVH